jgi:hypothetical protein
MAKKPIDDLVSRLNDLDDSQNKGQQATDVDDQAAEMDMWTEAVKDNYQEAERLRLEPDTLGQTLDTSTNQGGATASKGADVKTELGRDQKKRDFADVDEGENLNPKEDIGA